MQAYADLPQVLNDFKDGMVVLEFMDINNFGLDDEYILNKDIEDSEKSITGKQA